MSKLTEDECEFLLKTILSEHDRRHRIMLAPFTQELSHILMRKPPRPTMMPDGRIMTYVGPTATDLGGDYRPPRWLIEMAEGFDYSHALAKYRRQMGDET